MTIGEQIRMLREQRGMNQKRLAVLAGISTASMSLIETGGRFPSTPVLGRICKVLRCNLVQRLEPANEPEMDNLCPFCKQVRPS